MRFRLAVAFLIFTAYLGSSGLRAEGLNVGLRRFEVVDAVDGARIQGGLWFPATARTRPTRIGPFEIDVALDAVPVEGAYHLIAISHGTGGSWLGHHDTAAALVRGGFIVATFNHPYDNFADRSGAGQSLRLIARPRQLRVVLEQVLSSPAFGAILDQHRVGVFGYSAGGFTALVASGGIPDTERLKPYCADFPNDAVACTRALRGSAFQAADWPSMKETRIAAAVIAAPAFGFLFHGAGLAEVRIPLRLYRAEADAVVPNERNVAPLARELPTPVEPVTIPKAGHYVFLAPCSSALGAEVPEFCDDPPDVDRADIHQKMNAEIVAFFRRTLNSR